MRQDHDDVATVLILTAFAFGVVAWLAMVVWILAAAWMQR